MSLKGVMCSWSTEIIDGLFGSTEIEDLKAGILEIHLTYSATILTENKWTGEGRKKQITLLLSVNFMVWEVGRTSR